MKAEQNLPVKLAVRVNIRQKQEEPPIAIKVALLVHTSAIPPPHPNTIKHPIVPFAVLVDIRIQLEEPPIAIFALEAQTFVIPPTQPNTIKLTIVPFAVLAHIQHRLAQPNALVAVSVNILMI